MTNRCSRTAACVIACATLSFQATAAAASLSEVVQKHRNSTVALKVLKANSQTGATTETSGSGFIVNRDGFVMTAAHVVAGGVGLDVLVTGSPASRYGSHESMEVIFENTSLDVAVLRFRNTSVLRMPVTLGDSWTVSDTATIYVLGFPGNEEWFHTEGKLAGKGPKGSWNTTVSLNPGMSGGPVFDVEGKVVGMAWGGASGMIGINRILPISLLTDPLKFAGVNAAEGGIATASIPPLEVKYAFQKTQSTLLGPTAASRAYIEEFVAKEGHRISDFRIVTKSANNASSPQVSVSPDGRRATVKYELRSGPIFDQWRGWIDAEIVTKQTKE
jgi:hypothetical protein